jgi:hypothetical protein
MGLVRKLWRLITRAEPRDDRMRRVLEEARTRTEQELQESSGKAARRGPIRRIFK